MPKVLLTILAVVVFVSLLVWIGMKLKPEPFPPFQADRYDYGTRPIPQDLPKPVARFFQVIYGDEVPVIRSFILTGRGTVRFKGVTLPSRLRFIHDAGKGYRHYIESTFWGLPILKVNEHYLEGNTRLALPFGVVENEPQVDQAANLGLWSETLVFPAIYLTTDGVRWEAIDDHTARLVVPAQDGEDHFIVKFNEETGLVDLMEAMRWQNPGDVSKQRWQAQAIEWGMVEGWWMPTHFSAQWMDEDTPWLTVRVEEVEWNVDVDAYIKQVGIVPIE